MLKEVVKKKQQQQQKEQMFSEYLLILMKTVLRQAVEKELYVCVTGPDGHPITIPANGSGTFHNKR